LVDKRTLTNVLDELAEVSGSPYRAINGLWLCLVKCANLLPTAGEEHEQIASLLRRLSKQQASSVLSSKGVDELLALDPPLETVLSDPRERLESLKTAREVARLRRRRDTDPKAALLALFELLQRIRDKREHAFKSPVDQRAMKILDAAVSILRGLCELVGRSLLAETTTDVQDDQSRA